MTQAQHLTLLGRLSEAVALFNHTNPGECRNGENQVKVGIAARIKGGSADLWSP